MIGEVGGNLQKILVNIHFMQIYPPGRGKSGDLDNFDLDSLVQPMVDLIESINHPNSYVIGHSYGALMACEIGMKIGEKLSGLLAEDPGWVITYEGTDIKEWGPVPTVLKNKQDWKTSLECGLQHEWA
ncbi:MAG: hypothetical protein CM1200mP39_15440 [Dehalococcoidia bacterium]|nr:MAG: hypothetical protein CM1200mP39_15440 [Dehalococcoidia bacterium]